MRVKGWKKIFHANRDQKNQVTSASSQPEFLALTGPLEGSLVSCGVRDGGGVARGVEGWLPEWALV